MEFEFLLERSDEFGLRSHFEVVVSTCGARIEESHPHLGEGSANLVLTDPGADEVVLLRMTPKDVDSSESCVTYRLYNYRQGWSKIEDMSHKSLGEYDLVSVVGTKPNDFRLERSTGNLVELFADEQYVIRPTDRFYLEVLLRRWSWGQHFNQSVLALGDLWYDGFSYPPNRSQCSDQLRWINRVLAISSKCQKQQEAIDGSIGALGLEVSDDDESRTSNLAKLCPKSNPAYVSGPANGAVDNINLAVDLLAPHASEQPDWPHRLIGRHKGQKS